MVVRAEVEVLPWASDFFARRCGRIDFDAGAGTLTEAALTAFDIAEAKVSATTPELADGLSDLGFRFVDGEIDLMWTVEGGRGDIPWRRAVAEDIPVLRAIVAESVRSSRFRGPWYSPGERRRFYAQWVENAVLGTFDHECLVLRTGAVRGVVTMRALDDYSARIGLLAVADGWARRGIGGRLVAAAQQWCAESEISRLRVATQASNLDAIGFYQALGARVTGISHWMYR